MIPPAVLRNRDPILAVLRRVLPRTGLVLEVASGTGAHAAYFAAALPGILWQPSDVDPAAVAGIAGRCADAANVRPALALDVTRPGWPVGAADAVVCINMVHITPWACTQALLAGAGRVLPVGGILYLYGPYRIGGAHTAPSNAEFDASLRARDPAWGVRDLEAVVAVAGAHGLALADTVAMPANNVSVVLRRT